MTNVDEVISFPYVKGIEGLRSRWITARELAKNSFDAALIFPNSFDSALIPRCAGIPKRIGWPTDGRRFLLTHPLIQPDSLAHKQQWLHYLYLARKCLGTDTDAPASALFHLHIPANVQKSIDFVPEMSFQNSSAPLLAVNPGATYGDAKQWLPERFARVAIDAHNQINMNVILVGGPGDVDVCNSVLNYIYTESRCNTLPWCSSIAGKTSITQLAATLYKCACTVTNDTGGMHLSAAVGTPVVALFGPTDWNATAPLGNGHILISHPADCSPCFERTCSRDHACMKAISTDEVLSAVLSILSRSA